jgi:hypothetical protein
VILDEKSLAWQLEVAQLASREGWTVYDQTPRNRRQHAPSLVLIRGGRVILAYLRTTKRGAHAELASRMGEFSGHEVVLWTPGDKAAIKTTLTVPPPVP